MPGIGIILNPHSRANIKRPERIKRLGFIVGDKGSCHATQDVLDVENLAREFKEREIDVLGISGGDGTNHVTLTTFINEYGDKPLPLIAFLRGGTMNNLANTIGVKGSPERILSNLILKYHEDEPFQTTEVNMLKINDTYGFILGMGLASRFIDAFNNSEKKPSPMRALTLLSKTMISSVFNSKLAAKMCERFDARVLLDGKEMPFRNYIMLFAGTMETIGFNFRPLYRSREVPGEFQFVGISATPRHLLFNFPRAFLAKPSRSPNFLDEKGKEMVIELEKPTSYVIDGDVRPATNRIEISIGPRITCIVS